MPHMKLQDMTNIVTAHEHDRRKSESGYRCAMVNLLLFCRMIPPLGKITVSVLLENCQWIDL